jgi:type I restriction enzyme S subunit
MKVVKNNDSQNIEMYRRIENKLPSDWCVESIRNICDLQNGMAFKPDDKNDQGIGLPVVRIQNLNGSDKYDYYDEEVKKQFLIKNGDVLFAWSATLGGYLWRGGDAILNQHIFNVIPKDFTNKTWLYYLFNTIIKSRAYNDAHGGGGMVHVKKGVVQDYLIPFPPKDEQEKIANFLSERESYLQSIKTLISKMEQRNQYYLNETLKSEGFIKTNLGDLCTIKTGKLNANASSENGKYPFFTCSRNISRINDYAFDQEAILVAGNGVVGETKYYEGKFNAYQRTYVLGDFKIPAKYIFHYMKAFFQKRIEREVQGGVISYIKIDNIKDFEIHYPEDEDKLNETLKFIESNQRELELIRDLYSKEKQVFQWLCEKLVSGEYRIED